MRYAFTDSQLAWRDEVRAFIREHTTPALAEEMRRLSNEDVGPHAREFQEKLRAKGWWGLCWPKEYGGQARSAIELFIFIEEMTLANCPYLSLTYTSMAPTILRVGTEEQKSHWLPRITRGEIEFAAGYSEPEAGTDLASLRTRADLDGDDYVVNGQKTWNTGAHTATHQWLAVSTDQQAKKHQGISLLIVPMNAPGITVQPIYVWPGLRTNAVFFDNVRVPKDHLVGTPGMGFYYIAMALDFERIAIGSPAMGPRLFPQLVETGRTMQRDGRALAEDPAVRRKLARLATEIEVARWLAIHNAWAIDQGGVPTTEASMAKIFVSEL